MSQLRRLLCQRLLHYACAYRCRGKGFALTDAANGVTFDIAGSGTPVRLGWTAPDANNAFLALPGQDGLVHNGKQLFGNFTAQPASATPNGFAALAVFDDPKNGGNSDGVIDARDTVFTSCGCGSTPTMTAFRNRRSCTRYCLWA